MEIRPIIGWRSRGLEFIVNPIVDVAFGSGGGVDFLPAARLARKFEDDLAVALEYYTDFAQQSQQLFAVIDFKVGNLDIDFGLGRGLTERSDRWVAKTILTYAFPVEERPLENETKQDDEGKMRMPPYMKSSLRQTWALDAARDPFSNMR